MNIKYKFLSTIERKILLMLHTNHTLNIMIDKEGTGNKDSKYVSLTEVIVDNSEEIKDNLKKVDIYCADDLGVDGLLTDFVLCNIHDTQELPKNVDIIVEFARNLNNPEYKKTEIYELLECFNDLKNNPKEGCFEQAMKNVELCFSERNEYEN